MFLLHLFVAFLVVVNRCAQATSELSISGEQHSDYTIGSVTTGYFHCDAKCLVSSTGSTFVGSESIWDTHGSYVSVDEGSEMFVGHPGDQDGAFGYRFASAELLNSSISLIHNSTSHYHPYTRSTLQLTNMLLDNSSFNIHEWSNASQYQSNLQLQDSTVQTGDSNQLYLQGSKFVITKSSIELGELNQLRAQRAASVTMKESTFQTGMANQIKFTGTTTVSMMSSALKTDISNRISIVDSTVEPISSSSIQTGCLCTIDLQGATLSMTSSKITTGKGSEIRMADKSALSTNPLSLTIGDHSIFTMGKGANLYAVGSNCSITIGKRAELNIISICFFRGTLVVPDYTVKVIGEGDLPAGFTCMPTLTALKLFMSKYATIEPLK